MSETEREVNAEETLEDRGLEAPAPRPRWVPRWLGWLWLLCDRVLFEPRRRADRESAEFMRTPAAKRADWKVMWVMVTAAVSLTLLDYVAMSNRYGSVVAVIDFFRMDGLACRFDAWMDEWGLARHCAGMVEYNAGQTVAQVDGYRLNRLTYWAAGCFFVYFVIPALVIKLVLRERLRDYGLAFKGAFKDWWIYAVMFAIVAPLVLYVARDPHFQSTYPFYQPADGESLWPRFWIWELLYFSQFFALEFFFRGFMVHGTRHRLGFYSVFAMMIPYCMIHFGKPMSETLAAIIAGIVLGSLALKTRSIWMGVAIHATVALSMDFASLQQKGYFSGSGGG